eukprot:9761109-Ditylum_brightwellii.AAC.1
MPSNSLAFDSQRTILTQQHTVCKSVFCKNNCDNNSNKNSCNSTNSTIRIGFCPLKPLYELIRALIGVPD